MARRRRSRGGFKIPVISAAILGGQILAAGASSSGVSWTTVLGNLASFYTGFDPFGSLTGWKPERLIVGYGPWIVKGLAMKIARPFGGAPRLPLKGLPISLS